MKKLVLTALLALVLAQSAAAVCPASPPTLLGPADNTQVPFGNVVLNWSAAPAAYYEVWVKIDGGTSSLLGTTTLTQKTISVEPGRTIEWKVGAAADSCPTQYASYFSFTTSCPTLLPILQEPDPGESFAPGDAITFDWTIVPGAAGYDVRVTPDYGATFQTIASDITTTSFTTDDLPEGDWGWHVRANFDGSCTPLYSQPSSFLISGCSGATAPQLLAPAGNATVTQPFTVQWTNVGAKEYRVYMEQANQSPRMVGSTTSTSLAVNDLEGGAWAWWVVARFDGCPDVSTARRVVNVTGAAGCPSNPGKATLVAPAPNATNLASPVTFSWSAVPNATGYRVLVFFGDGEPTVLGTTTGTSLSARLPSGTALWLVQTLFGEDCPTTLSERRTFTVTQGASCSTTAPQLIAPANGQQQVDSPVLFKWSSVPDAIGYSVHVSAGSGDDFLQYGTTDAKTTELERLVPRGRVDWFVVAHFSGCPDVRSAIFTFGTESECELGSVQILTPAAGADVASPVTVSWAPVSSATQYRLTLKSENGAIALSSRTTNTTETLRLPAGTFLIQVEALRDGCESSSSERRFTVREAAACASNPAPAIVSPAGTQSQPTQAQSPVTLTWSAAANALGYRVWVGRDDEPFEDVALTAQTSDQVELEPGRYRWFVQALFEGCAPTRSEVAYFVIPDTEGCTRQAPAIVTPAAGATVSSPVTIDWSEVPGAERYRVLALIADKPALLGVTEDTQLTSNLPPGEYTIVVQAVFEECASTESPRTRFTVRRASSCPTEKPQLVSPANGATNVDPEVDFVWTPVSGAIEYVLVAKVNDETESVLGTTSGTQLRRRVARGTITWTVVAIFPGCDPQRAPASSFTVPRPQSCSDRKPVLLFPIDDGRVVPSPVEFTWLAVPKAIEYRVWARRSNEPPAILATSTATSATVDLPAGAYRWFVEARFDGTCGPAFSAEAAFKAGSPAACGTPLRPEASVIGQALSGADYQLRWTPLPRVSRYEVQESTSLDFNSAASFTSVQPAMTFRHVVTGTPVQYLYRVRGVSDCNDARGPYSAVVGVFVVNTKTPNASSELGTAVPIVQTVFLKGGATPQPFSARADKPWITINPSSGTVPLEGLTLTVSADPSTLGIGTNTATIQVTYGTAGGGVATHTTPISIPTSISLVTPVMPGGKGTPPPDALIFGAVGHASGINDSLFESDIRLTNLTAQTMKYDLTFTPSGVDGTQTGITSTIEVAPGGTVALDDVVASAFGSGTVGSSLGMLEVRPATAPESSGFFGSVTETALRQVASSRTYNFTPAGTFGQYIPATRFADFVGRNTVLSLQQVAQSTAFRANFGFLEGSGQPAELAVRVYDTKNNLLTTIPVSLGAMQHRQMNGLLASNGITDLADGRVEVEVISGDGKVTAYVSEVDNATNDPLLVSPVVKGATRANRYVVPGMAYINTGSAFWVTDLRIYNAGTAATPATLTFYPEGNPAGALTRDIVLDPGEIEVLDNVLVNLFNFAGNIGGSIAITTPAETSLTATARTYNQTTSGTYGQFIPGVTVAESVGLGERSLQILQVEQSARIRTNVGVNETSGKPVTVEISLITPDALTTSVITVNLQANEYRQIGLIDPRFGVSDAVYNGRVSVKVVGGEGRITAYGSAIDQITQDPTYVPAQ